MVPQPRARTHRNLPLRMPQKSDCINASDSRLSPHYNHLSTRKTAHRDLWYKRHSIPSRFFGVAAFAARIPFVLADAGDDFSNNLFSDLAPVLALFGEQVAKQYMSQSMSWVENVIFAMAPLGIITAMTGAIRVGGPTWMKAVIGRAREGKGVVEVELMSSTSSDVCELWNGDGIVRVLGSAEILELYYLESAPVISVYPEAQNTGSAGNIELSNLEATGLTSEDNADQSGHGLYHATGIYNFDLAKKLPKILQLKSSSRLQSNLMMENGEPWKTTAPNIALNLAGQRVSDFELKVVALIGTLLQISVLVFAGLGVLWSQWNGKFNKAGKQPLLYAFPTMAAGTVALVVGMFLCAHIIDRSTVEETWVVEQSGRDRVRVAWLQKGGSVSDQQFDSYLIQRGGETPKIWAYLWNAASATLWKKVFVKFPSVYLTFHRWLRLDDRDQIISSRREDKEQQLAILTTVAISVSLVGFIAQFVGLRGLNWWVTIAQLLAVGIMVVLRAIVRRNLVHKVQPQRIDSGYELDTLAKQMKGCNHWSVVSWGFDSDGITSNGLASVVLDARCRLHELSHWECQWKKAVDSTSESIVVAMNLLCKNSDVDLKSLLDTFSWNLIVEVAPLTVEVDTETVTGLTDGVAAGNRVLQSVQLSMSRKWIDGGRGWGDWKVDKYKIEAALGLWMLHFKDLEAKQAFSKAGVLRVINPDGKSSTAYEQWVRREAQIIATDNFGRISSGENRYEILHFVGKPSTLPNGASPLQAVISEAPLENICGQIILSAFISEFVGTVLKSIGGKVRVRIPGDKQPVKASFGFRNTVLDELAEKVEQTGLANVEDVLLCCVPPLEKADKLPKIGLTDRDVFSKIEKEIMIYFQGGRLEQAEPFLLWLLDATEFSANAYEREKTWNKSCEVYLRLCSTYDRAPGSEDYAEKAEEAMALLCQRWSLSAGGPWGLRGPDQYLFEIAHESLPVEEKMDEGVYEGRSQRWKEKLRGWEDRLTNLKNTSHSQSDNDDDDELCNSSAAGNCFRVAQLLLLTGINIDLQDSLGRTPLILASMFGHATAVWQLLKEDAKVDIRDAYGRTAMHYASIRGHTSVNRILCSRTDVSVIIDMRDKTDQTPLGLAITSNDGATVALLIFCGAKDAGNAMSKDQVNSNDLLEKSIQYGSPAAVNEIAKSQQINSKELGRTPLHWSTWRDSRESIKTLLSAAVKADVEARDDSGHTALHYAAMKGRTEIAEMLIASGATVDVAALYMACENGHEATVRLLLEKGADIHGTGRHHSNVLEAAAYSGCEVTVRLLLKKGAGKYYEDCIKTVAERKHGVEARILLENSAYVDNPGIQYANALQTTAQKMDKSAIQLLLKHSAHIDASGVHYENALRQTAQNENEGAFSLLLECGAHVNASDTRYGNALLDAARSGRKNTVQLLLEKGANVHVKDRLSITPLHFAAMYGHETTVELLLQNLANIQAEDAKCNTPLHLAAERGHDATVKMLLKKSANIEARNWNLYTPLHLAVQKEQLTTVQLLLEHGVNIEAQDDDSRTPLHLAVQKEQLTTVQLLLEHGANITAQDNHNRTPLDLAKDCGCMDIANLLRNYAAKSAQTPNSGDP
ncbi:ankyrin [Wilcoxina mikolae CBS 423.85]|nr:ankyrin [Wilcoxina mikolae CBS 423.85]